MTNCNLVSYISQHRQIHMGTHIYHVCNILFGLIRMLDFLVITDIVTFDLSNDGHIQSLHTISVV
jgi:hypothetical protein